jgi:K+-sensing histidine kinase KdpD
MKFDAYALKSRIAPAFVSMIVPIMLFNFFFSSPEFAKFVGDVLGAKIFANLTISLVCLYYLSEAGRFVAKHVFERLYFKNETYMPTTDLLMFENDTYSTDYKTRIRQRIKRDFKIQLPTPEEEAADNVIARRRIVETMALVRKKLAKNSLLSQHNTEYGAVRNLIGGSAIGLVFSMINILFFSAVVKNPLAVYISIVTLACYMVIILASRLLLSFYGFNYAKILFREYMGSA